MISRPEGKDERQSAKDTIDFIKEAIPEFVNAQFWRELKKLAEQEGELFGEEEITPMDDENASKFLNERIPNSKYAGHLVRSIYKLDRTHLVKLALTPTLFQQRLMKFLARDTKDG